jgi:regulator of protease activity HflC (stomatin/prohibitin superfamily)
MFHKSNDVFGIVHSQAAAEREKRQKVKNAEADKQATVLAAEAQRQRDTNESEGARVRLINEAEGHARKVVLQAEAEKSRLINEAQGRAEAALLDAKAAADSIRLVAASIDSPSGQQALQADLAQKYIVSLRSLGAKSNTIFLPQNAGDVASMVTHATSIFKTLSLPDASSSSSSAAAAAAASSSSSSSSSSAARWFGALFFLSSVHFFIFHRVSSFRLLSAPFGSFLFIWL